MSITPFQQLDKTKFEILSIIGADTSLRRVASTGGGEYAGACPFCGGVDRFRVQPSQGEWFCRGCGGGQWHDAIDYIQKKQNVGFLEALKILGADTKPDYKINLPSKLTIEPEPDRSAWIEQAWRFIERCQDDLQGANGKRARAWLLARGIDGDAVQKWRLGYNTKTTTEPGQTWGLDGEADVYIPRGIVIPCFDSAGLHYVKTRRPEGLIKYTNLKGSSGWCFGLGSLLGAASAFLFESEFDAILANSLLPGAGSIALPAGGKIKECYASWFIDICRINVCYDTDEPGKKAGAELAKLDGFQLANDFPQGKDFGEYYQAAGGQAAFDFLYNEIRGGD